MALEIRVIAPTEDMFIDHIIWNADEIEREVAAKVGYYKNLVYTEDQVTEAKKDRAQLNKFIAALKAKDKEIKDLCLKPYDEFHNKMLKIISLVEEPATLIDVQVKEFEESQKKKKAEAIQALFSAKGFQPWVTLERIWNPKWLNKSYTMKQVDADLTTIQHKIGEDILLINSLGEGMQAALGEYTRSMDVSAAVAASRHYIEARAAEEQLARQMAAQPSMAQQANLFDAEIMPEPVPAPTPSPAPVQDAPQTAYSDGQPIRKELMFKVFVTFEEMQKLNQFLIENKIQFRQINKAQALS